MIKRLHISLVLVSLTTFLLAQDFEIRAVVVDATTVGIELRETSGSNTPTTGDIITGCVFALKWSNSSNNDLGTIDNSSGYNVVKSGVEEINGSEEFQSFAITSDPFFPSNWTEDSWEEICQINSDNGNFTGTLDICPTGWLDNTTDPYFGVNLNDYTPTINGSANFTVLPAVLSKFEVMKRNGLAYLLWCTVSEINVSHYEVEKSIDAVDWAYIGEVRAEGISFGALDYGYEDLSTFAADTEGVVYYRLKMVDLDGSYEYSEVKSLDFGQRNINALTVSPNPSSHITTISFSKGHGFSSLKLLDVSGRLLYESTVSNLQQIDLDLEKMGLSEGLYLLFFETIDQEQQVEKLLVK